MSLIGMFVLSSPMIIPVVAYKLYELTCKVKPSLTSISAEAATTQFLIDLPDGTYHDEIADVSLIVKTEVKKDFFDTHYGDYESPWRKEITCRAGEPHSQYLFSFTYTTLRVDEGTLFSYFSWQAALSKNKDRQQDVFEVFKSIAKRIQFDEKWHIPECGPSAFAWLDRAKNQTAGASNVQQLNAKWKKRLTPNA